MTRLTVSVGPMLPRKGPEKGPIEVSYGEEASTKSKGRLPGNE